MRQHNNFNSFDPLTDSSTHTTENISPSLTPPPSAPSKSPLNPAYMQKDSGESDDDQEIIEEDDDDNDDRHENSGSPNSSLQSKRKKKTRTVFSRAQVFQLESTFDMKR